MDDALEMEGAAELARLLTEGAGDLHDDLPDNNSSLLRVSSSSSLISAIRAAFPWAHVIQL